MRLVVLGLDGASSDLLLGREDLPNLLRLMEAGCYGRLAGVLPATSVPEWMCMATGQDPGSLGVYGPTGRRDRSYAAAAPVDAGAFTATAVWDVVAASGGRSVVVGVPPGRPPRSADGVWIEDERSGSTAESLVDASRRRFETVRRHLQSDGWDYLHVVDASLDNLHRAPSFRDEDVQALYRHLDEEVGAILGAIDEDTAVLVGSGHAARRDAQRFHVNDWLAREGLLVRGPAGDVDWARTTCWGEDGAFPQIFVNLKGRESRGKVEASNVMAVRDDVAARLRKAVPGALALKPEEIYRQVRGVAPDLIVRLGDDGATGAFVLASPAEQPHGELEGVTLLDLAPTLLQLSGRSVPETMQGRALVSQGAASARTETPEEEEERLVRERLSGLGYI